MTNGEANESDGRSIDPNRDSTNDPADRLTGNQPADIDAGETEVAGGELAADSDEASITSELAWVGRGFFQPLYSLQFYRAAVQKSLIDAILFFAVFGTLLTIISTFNLSRNLSSAAVDLGEITTDIAGLDAEIEPLEEGRLYKVLLTLQPGMAKGDFEGLVTISTNSTKQPIIEVSVKGKVL